MATAISTTASNEVSRPNAQYRDMAEEWRMIDALLGGTRAMRKEADFFLPRFEGEDETAYQFRLKWSYLFNYFKRAVKALVGKPFARPISQPADLSVEMLEIVKDFDMMGNDITICMKKWFECAMAKGVSYGLIDYPDTGGMYLSRADEKAKKVRPYFCHISAADIIGWQTISWNGVRKLQQVRIKQCLQEPTGNYADVEKESIRVITWLPENAPGQKVAWELHIKNDKGEYVLVKSGFMSAVDEIPLVPLYTAQTGFMTAEPPLVDLAYVNVAHWQSNSDFRHIAHILSVPILFAAGWDPKTAPKAMQVGPNRMITTGNTEAKLSYVEHTGAAVELLQNYMSKLEDEMATMAIRLLQERASGGVTATEVSVDSASAESALKSMVTSLQDAMEWVIYFMQVWMNQYTTDDALPQFKVNKDFGLLVGNDFIANWLLKANAQGIVQKKTVLDGAKQLGYVAEDLDVEAELDAADEESAKAFADMNAALGDNAPPGAGPTDPPTDKKTGGGDKGGNVPPAFNKGKTA